MIASMTIGDGLEGDGKVYKDVLVKLETSLDVLFSSFFVAAKIEKQGCINDDEKAEEEHVRNQRGNEKAGDAQAKVYASKPQSEKPEATKVSSSIDLSSAEFTSQFLNNNPDVNVNEVLKDTVEPEFNQWRISNFQSSKSIDKLVKAHLKKGLLADVPNIGKIKMVKAAKKSMPKYSPKPFDQAALDEFDQKDRLFQMMSKSMSYNKHPTHKALYDALAVSLSVDEDDIDKSSRTNYLEEETEQDDHDQDPS
ncbi:hypothetical protein Tco_0580784 [Tanacetum coccineum]